MRLSILVVGAIGCAALFLFNPLAQPVTGQYYSTTYQVETSYTGNNGSINTTYSFSSPEYFQGDSGSITFTITNSHSYQICTKQTYIQFDWQVAQSQAYIDSSDTPCVATGNSYTFTIQFSVPSDESVGSHSYTVAWVDSGYLLGTQTLVSNNLYIHDAFEKVYDNSVVSVHDSVSQYQGMNFQGPTAQSDLSQAVSYYNQATSLAGQGQWQQAVSDLNQASSYASQAYSAEQAYQSAQQAAVSSQIQASSSQSVAAANSAQTDYIIVGGIVAVIVVVIIGFIILSRRKKPTRTTPSAT